MIFISFFSVVWILLSGYFSFIPLVPGILSIFLIGFLLRRSKKIALYYHKFDLTFMNFLLYVPYIFKEMTLSNIHLVKVILANEISPRIITCNNDFDSKSAVTTFCNSVNLTPGSFILDANKDRILIHVIDKDIEYGMLSHDMENKIKGLRSRSIIIKDKD